MNYDGKNVRSVLYILLFLVYICFEKTYTTLLVKDWFVEMKDTYAKYLRARSQSEKGIFIPAAIREFFSHKYV